MFERERPAASRLTPHVAPSSLYEACRAVCIAFPPPRERFERVALSLYGASVAQRVRTAPGIVPLVSMTFCSMHSWSVGDLPFFIYATAKDGAELEKLERALTLQLEDVHNDSASAQGLVQMRAMLSHISNTVAQLTPDQVRNTARMMVKRQGADEQRGVGMVIGQAAINWGVSDQLLGSQPANVISRLGALTPEAFRSLVRRHLADEKRIVTHLIPADDRP